MNGSTLYRRLPDGTWAAQREDIPVDPDVPADYSKAVAALAGGAAVAAVASGPGVPAGAAVGPASVGAGVAAASTPAPPAPPAQVPPAQVPPAAPPSAVPAGAPGPAPKKRGPIRIWIRRIVSIVVVAALAYAAWIVGLLIYAAANLPQIEALSPEPISDTEGQVWLLVGSDSREGLTPEQQKELHTGGDVGQRTDTIMLAYMRPGETPKLVSLPRDSWVTIPAHTASDGRSVSADQAKINAAFSIGGAPLLSETIEYNTGLHIDHYLEISMYGVVALTDAVGGIEVCFDEPIQDEKSGLDVEAGCQILDGQEALAWVRMRYSDPKGDLGRIERQQEFVKLIMEEILSWETLTHPGRQLDIVNAVLQSVFVDLETGSIDLGRFGIGMGRIVTGAGEVTTVPLIPGSHWEEGQSVVKWDEADAEQLFASMGGSPPQAG